MTSNRERFEEWYLAEFWEGSNCGRAMLKKEHCGGYTYAKPQEMWKVWQAAQPAAGEPAADLHRLFEDAWANALCSDEGVPGKRPLRSLSDREQYRGGGVNAAWRWFQRGAQLSAPPAAAHGDEAVPNLVPGLQWAIDYCNAMLRQGNDRMLVEVIRTRLENVLGNQPAAMRAQAGDHD